MWNFQNGPTSTLSYSKAEKERERQEKLEAIRIKEEMRKKQIEDSRKKYRKNLKMINKNPLYKQIEERFQNDYVIPELERK